MSYHHSRIPLARVAMAGSGLADLTSTEVGRDGHQLYKISEERAAG
jgi:hypothetical protein